jgi:hypothetical protein
MQQPTNCCTRPPGLVHSTFFSACSNTPRIRGLARQHHEKCSANKTPSFHAWWIVDFCSHLRRHHCPLLHLLPRPTHPCTTARASPVGCEVGRLSKSHLLGCCGDQILPYRSAGKVGRIFWLFAVATEDSLAHPTLAPKHHHPQQ